MFNPALCCINFALSFIVSAKIQMNYNIIITSGIYIRFIFFASC